jgi:predicted transcriptional regulator
VVLIDDYIVAIGAAVITAGVVLMAVFLARYRVLVSESKKSSDLAKNVWDSMNSRLSVMDTRIIDLMAKVEVYSVRGKVVQPAKPFPTQVERQRDVRPQNLTQTPPPSAPQTTALPVALPPALETEVQILQVLAQGPKTSSEIKDVVGRSREHTARLMKILFGRGLVIRNDRNKPYLYEITESGRRYLAGS